MNRGATSANSARTAPLSPNSVMQRRRAATGRRPRAAVLVAAHVLRQGADAFLDLGVLHRQRARLRRQRQREQAVGLEKPGRAQQGAQCSASGGYVHRLPVPGAGRGRLVV